MFEQAASAAPPTAWDLQGSAWMTAWHVDDGAWPTIVKALSVRPAAANMMTMISKRTKCVAPVKEVVEEGEED